MIPDDDAVTAVVWLCGCVSMKWRVSSCSHGGVSASDRQTQNIVRYSVASEYHSRLHRGRLSSSSGVSIQRTSINKLQRESTFKFASQVNEQNSTVQVAALQSQSTEAITSKFGSAVMTIISLILAFQNSFDPPSVLLIATRTPRKLKTI